MISQLPVTQRLWLLVSVVAFVVLTLISMVLLVPGLSDRHSNVSPVPYVSGLSAFLDEQQEISAEQFRDYESRFSAVANPVSFGHTTATIWLKARITNPTEQQNWVVTLGNRDLAPVSVYQLQADDLKLLYQQPGNIRSTSYVSLEPAAAVTLAPGAETVLLISARSFKTTLVDIRLQTPQQALQADNESAARVLLCVGILSGLIFINLMMFVSLRQPYQGFYALQELGFITIVLVESGFGINYFWPGNVYVNDSVLLTGLFVMIASSALFTCSFFVTSTASPVHKLLKGIAVLSVACLGLLYTEPARTLLLQGGAPAIVVLLFLVSLLFGGYQLRQGKIHALPYFLSMSLLFIFSVPIIYAAFSGATGMALVVFDTFVLLTVAEAILLAIAVNMRLDTQRLKRLEFDRQWIETLDARLVEASRLQQLTREKNLAVEGSVNAIKRLSTTSHDIHHALYSIRLHLEILRQQVQGDEAVSRIEDGLTFIADITRQLIDEGLNQVRDDQEYIDFDELFSQVQAQVSPLVREKGLQLVVSATGEHYPGSTVVMRRMLENLVRNAVRYTSRGQVTLAVNREDSCLCLRVSDTGRGMSPDQVQLLLNAPDNIEALTDTGFGLGLGIVSALCQQMGYQLNIQSELHEGTQVEILLPLET